MIPLHILPKDEIKEIKIVELPKLTKLPVSEAHRHDFYECFLFLKGGGIHTIDFVDFPIQDNSVHLITPGQVHQIKRNKNSYGFVYMFDLLHFNQFKSIEDFLFDHACFDVKEFSPIYHFEDSFTEVLHHLAKQIFNDFQLTGALKNQIIINQLSQLILYCMQQTMDLHSNVDHRNNDVYTSFRRLLSANFRTIKKVKDYAVQLNISEKILNEIILQRTGDNVSNLIFKQVLLEAKRLLKSGVSAKEVAYDLNFSDPAHFSKFFKIQTGISPSEFNKYK